ncbi:MAG TPA: ATP-binding SpoIIE family protein phosphatase [Kineosporiaceae bacterium]
MGAPTKGQGAGRPRRLDRDASPREEVCPSGLALALALVTCCYVMTVLLAPPTGYEGERTFALSLNAGVAGALSVLPSRRQFPAFLLAAGVLSIAVWRPVDAETLRLAIEFAAADLVSLGLFRSLVRRFAGACRPDSRTTLVALLCCGLATVTFHAAAGTAVGLLARSTGWMPASIASPSWYLLATRATAQVDGMVTIVPLVWTLARHHPRSWSLQAWGEIGSWLALLVAASAVAVDVRGAAPLVPLLVLVSFAGLVFAVLRRGRLAAAVLSPAFAVLAAAVLLSTAPAGERPGGPSTLLPSQLAGFLAAVLAWAVSTVVIERDEARRLAAAEAAARTALTSLQTALLPRDVGSGPGVHVAVRYRAADALHHLGGDWYDTIALPGGGTALVIGDVEGHDLTAASVMGLVRGAVRSYALEAHTPSMVLERVSTFLVSAGIDRLVTMAYAEVHPDDGTVTIALGGHPQPLVVPRDGQARMLSVRGGPLLGLEGLDAWPEQTLRLPPKAALVLYTDGLVDFPTADADQAGRILALATGGRDRPIEVLADSLISAAPTYDDAAVLAALVGGEPGSWARRTFPAHPRSASLARAWLSDLFQIWTTAGHAEVPPATARDEARLLLTELVANAVRHGDGALGVRLRLRDQRLRIEVADVGERMPAPSGPDVAADAPGGRGLRLVETLADSWGTDLDEHGKVVWCELDLAPLDSGPLGTTPFDSGPLDTRPLDTKPLDIFDMFNTRAFRHQDLDVSDLGLARVRYRHRVTGSGAG